MYEIKPMYLQFTAPEANKNKFYNAVPNENGTFTVTWGRVGTAGSSTTYNISMWNKKISEKIDKGYRDMTSLKLDLVEEKVSGVSGDKFASIAVPSVKEVLKRLYDIANHIIQKSYTVASMSVTQAMIDKAQEYIDFIATNRRNLSVAEFNKNLVDLFNTIPRKMAKVADYTATSKDDFDKIIGREQDLLDTMRGQVYVKPKVVNDVATTSVIDELGISIEEASSDEITMLKKKMGDASGKFYKAWKVTNKESEERFQKFVKDNKIGNVKLVCHGSRNQNWFNILKTGLKIRPAGATYTGSMFGDGIYWSNPDKWHGVAKSIGYTSLDGYWTGERNKYGFIAFFDCALGESEDAYSFDSKYYSYNLKTLQRNGRKNVWSLFAHGGTSMLRNDEIIVYDDRQMTIRYLVEIR